MTIHVETANLSQTISPKSKPFFKTKPEVVQLKMSMERWQEVLQRGLPLLDRWEIIVKPGIKKTRHREAKRDQKTENEISKHVDA